MVFAKRALSILSTSSQASRTKQFSATNQIKTKFRRSGRACPNSCNLFGRLSRRRAARDAGAVHVVDRRACTGCGLSQNGARTRDAERARFCAAQGNRRAGKARAWCSAAQGTRAAQRRARDLNIDTRGRTDRRRMGKLAKNRDKPIRRAWTAVSGGERRQATLAATVSRHYTRRMLQ